MIRPTKSRLTLFLIATTAWAIGQAGPASAQNTVEVHHKIVKVGGLDIFYREAGPKDAPTILLLHGFPTSSQMFRKLIPALGTGTTWSRPTTPATATARCRRMTSSPTPSTTSPG